MSDKVPLADREHDAATSSISVKTVAVMAIFIALSAVGALVKLPSVGGTVALDAAPGFFVALGFSGPMGAFVALCGHLLTAAISGFPLSVPVHLIIAVGMGVCAWLLGIVGRRGTIGLVAGIIVAIVLNSLVMGLILLPVGGVGLYVSNLLPLAIGAAVNLAVAVVAYLALRSTPLLDADHR